MFYHVYNRGTEKRKIFLDKQDYERFLSSIIIFNDRAFKGRLSDIQPSSRHQYQAKESLVTIHAYCLLDNHFHFIVSCDEPKHLSLFMQRIGTGYSMYFNKKYERSGALFQGTYKKKLIDTQEYLVHLLSYVSFNFKLHNCPVFRSSYDKYFIKDKFEFLCTNIVESIHKDFKSFQKYSLKIIQRTSTYRRYLYKE